MSNNNCMFCDTNLLCVGPTDNMSGTFYNCQKCGKYSVNDDDTHYFQRIYEPEREYYATELQRTKGQRNPATQDLNILMQSWLGRL